MIRFQNVSRSYHPGDGTATVHALRGVNLEIGAGEFVAITGESGSGKSTLLHLLGALDTPDEGSLHVGDLALHKATEREKTLYRRSDVGIVFQFFNLMPTLTVAKNVALPLSLQGVPDRESLPRATELLAQVGLGGRATHLPHQLSGGEMQRVAIARALVHRPRLLIADEPTGNLDSANAARIMDVFRAVHREATDPKVTLIVVTHSEEIAATAPRHLRMADGRFLPEP